jgi:hypothetical protein
MELSAENVYSFLLPKNEHVAVNGKILFLLCSYHKKKIFNLLAKVMNMWFLEESFFFLLPKRMNMWLFSYPADIMDTWPPEERFFPQLAN